MAEWPSAVAGADPEMSSQFIIKFRFQLHYILYHAKSLLKTAVFEAACRSGVVEFVKFDLEKEDSWEHGCSFSEISIIKILLVKSLLRSRTNTISFQHFTLYQEEATGQYEIIGGVAVSTHMRLSIFWVPAY